MKMNIHIFHRRAACGRDSRRGEGGKFRGRDISRRYIAVRDDRFVEKPAIYSRNRSARIFPTSANIPMQLDLSLSLHFLRIIISTSLWILRSHCVTYINMFIIFFILNRLSVTRNLIAQSPERDYFDIKKLPDLFSN